MGDETNGEKDESYGASARDGLVLEDQDCGTDDGCAKRKNRSYEKGQEIGEPHGGDDEKNAPDAEDTDDELFALEHLFEAEIGEPPKGDGCFVIGGESHMWMLDQQIVLEYGWIPDVFKDGDVDLGVGLQPGVAGELEKIK